jgi:hypothetical protein
MWGAIYWLINFPLICCLFFFTPTLWVKLGIFITLIYSIYANLATDYGAMSAAEAAFGEPQPPPIPLEPPQPLAPRLGGASLWALPVARAWVARKTALRRGPKARCRR